MKNGKLLSILLALSLLLTGCAANGRQEDADFSIACTTYPVYLLANTIAGGVEGVTVSLVIDQEVSCLHDYTLTMRDMRTVESADVIVCNGAGLESFLDQVLEGRQVIDCAQDVDLLYGGHHHGEEEAHHHHGEESDAHDGETADPHIWMDPSNYRQMAATLTRELSALDPDHADVYQEQGEACAAELDAFYEDLLASETCQALQGSSIITFHDGFSYFAQAFGLEIAAAIEEEEGAEASALELKETISVVQAQHLPAVFTEVNGSDKAAYTISRECGVSVHPLTMLMSGPEEGTIEEYQSAIRQNLQTILEAYA